MRLLAQGAAGRKQKAGSWSIGCRMSTGNVTLSGIMAGDDVRINFACRRRLHDFLERGILPLAKRLARASRRLSKFLSKELP
jgi:hypothetical protein